MRTQKEATELVEYFLDTKSGYDQEIIGEVFVKFIDEIVRNASHLRGLSEEGLRRELCLILKNL